LKQCYLLRTVASGPEIVLRRTAAVGDSLAASIVADKLTAKGYAVHYQTHPNNWCLLRRQPSIARLSAPDEGPHINLDGAYEEDPRRQERHFHEMFMERAQEQVRGLGIELGPVRNCNPRIVVAPEEKESYTALLSKYPRPWVMICPRSNSYNVRMVPNHIWSAAARQMQGTCFWLGTTPAPPPIVDLGVRHLDNVILWLSVADVLVSVDTGPLHIGAALGVPLVAIGQSSSPELHLSDQCDFVTIAPALDCLNCQKNICPKGYQFDPPCSKIDPDYVATWVNARSGSVYGGSISAAIAVYRPEAAILNRCLDAILPQVSEIVVCRDRAGSFPSGMRTHEKIRYIVKPADNVGYGRKANYAARHTSGRYILFLNDDLYAHAGMVDKLRAAMTPRVAVTAPLLRFKDGRIQHAGMVRDGNGGVGYGHIDYGKFNPTFTDTREVECVTGAAILVDRRSFYGVGAISEDYYLYCEDTDLMMRIRQAGHKIVYVPEATGIHDEHLSTGKTPNIIAIMQDSNRRFGERWRWYFERNRGVPGLGTFA
jgi:GT2 family glycosyltransferase